ncbi:acetyl-CoA hydrolase [Alkalicaulis satelles]|uniref:Acetyl-CoA hydrolase n=1 Tax=Alkalicaulis satelles TaxID=2609175 RepID=A0A5M6ZPA2_9PROT|nr:acetyl-CoA hydrolase/transferase C-terminal domain-containing protein [Alkalicaulis satelles]KAA5804051.1 acetyl-CoA hydrolase [Alkalicaulis satelles]
MSGAPVIHTRVEAAVDALLAETGNDIVLGLPLGLGKPNPFVNALYRRAVDDPALKLTILTALTLDVPEPAPGLESRFMAPILERLYKDYEPLAYAADRRRGTLPANVQVHEFFMQPGALTSNSQAQQAYMSANYTHAARDLLDRGVNVIAQLVAVEGAARDRVSLSCNPDVAADLMPVVEAGRRGGRRIHAVGQIHPGLPYMYGPADQPASAFDHLIDDRDADFTLFATPRRPVDSADQAAALHIAGLAPDGGTLQIGIGSLGDAVSAALILRHEQPGTFAEAQARLAASDAQHAPETGAFEQGLYGCSEMFVDGFLQLYRAGVLKRRVYDDLDTQLAVNAGKPGPHDGGAVLHGGFFLGPPDFYTALNALSAGERALFPMAPVSQINQLYGGEALRRAQRQGARFINNAIMATLMGAAVSDQLEDGRVISGVGGQYNFVAQAHELDGARSILMVRATRTKDGEVRSNIVWNYGHVTIPRHLRDIIVTEYGVADLRGQCDRDVIAAMLNIADSRFQPGLLAQAKKAGKIEPDYEIPAGYRNNRPERIEEALAPARKTGALKPFPFGSEFTDEEIRLAKALRQLQARTRSPLRNAAWLAGALLRKPRANHASALARMGLAEPGKLRDRAYARLLSAVLPQD